MSHYIFIRRLMGPSILLLLGVVILLRQVHVVHLDIFVPLLLILIGVLKLAERAALAAEDYPPPPQSWPPYPGAPNPPAGPAGPNPAGHSTAMIVPSAQEFRNDSGGGRS